MAAYIPKRHGRGEWILGAVRLVNYGLTAGVLAYVAFQAAKWIAALAMKLVFG